MVSRKALKGVLHGFLGTFTSRYSDYHGYWLFGFLVGGPMPIECDLLTPVQADGGLRGVVRDLAARRFAEQLDKAGVNRACVRQATVRLERRPGSEVAMVGGHQRTGMRLSVRASVTADNGRVFEEEVVLFVAPHDPSIEFRSAREA